jgi:hypothetical protein
MRANSPAHVMEKRFDAAILPTQIEYAERIAFARDSGELKWNFDFSMDRI